MEFHLHSVITGVRFADLNKTIYIEIEVGQLLPMGLINSSTVRWQGPPIDLVTNVLAFNFTIFTFHLDKVHIKKGFLSGFQIFLEDKSWRLRVFSKLFENFVQGLVSDREEIHTDSNTHRQYFLSNKNVMVSKRPGRISTNENYKIGFGTSNQISKNFNSLN